MSTQIIITLPDEIYQRAERFARLANRDIASILVDTIQLSIPPVSGDITNLQPVSILSDEQVLMLTELQMESAQDAQLSELLVGVARRRHRQQSGTLTECDRTELQTLMQVYQEGLLRKATALSEAVKRGLIEPLN
ncbi:hypothetical protein [Nostoc sp.]|uniref:hypothetical protein n=1 Tax=Nostoc sp. TaxID=1180 RepID=UPI003592FD2B